MPATNFSIRFPASRSFAVEQAVRLASQGFDPALGDGPMMELVIFPVAHTHPRIDLALTHMFGKTPSPVSGESDECPEPASGCEESDCA